MTEIDTLDEQTAPPSPAPTKTRTRRSPSRRSSRAPKVSVRQVADKAQQLAAASADEREVLAELMGTPSASIADLTVAICEARKNPVRDAIDDLHVIQESEIPRATIHLVGMDKEAHEALVRLLGVVSAAELPEKIPPRATDAALALIDPVREAEVDLASLDTLLALLEV